MVVWELLIGWFVCGACQKIFAENRKMVEETIEKVSSVCFHINVF